MLSALLMRDHVMSLKNLHFGSFLTGSQSCLTNKKQKQTTTNKSSMKKLQWINDSPPKTICDTNKITNWLERRPYVKERGLLRLRSRSNNISTRRHSLVPVSTNKQTKEQTNEGRMKKIIFFQNVDDDKTTTITGISGKCRCNNTTGKYVKKIH